MPPSSDMIRAAPGMGLRLCRSPDLLDAQEEDG